MKRKMVNVELDYMMNIKYSVQRVRSMDNVKEVSLTNF